MDAYDTVTSGIVRLSYDSMAWNAAWQSCENNAPATSVAALPVASPATFTINWSGMDAGGSEFKNFDVQLKIGAGAWTDWQLATTTTSAPFTGIVGHTYYFRSRGRDNAGNLEAYPGNPDAFTTVEALAPETGMTPLPTVVPYQFNVSWGGTDPGGSGIASYDVQVRDGPGGVWTDWQMGTTGTSAPYTGLGGHTYYFRSRARDYATNLEAWPVDYDAYTLVEGYAPNSEIVHLSAYTRGEALGVVTTGRDQLPGFKQRQPSSLKPVVDGLQPIRHRLQTTPRLIDRQAFGFCGHRFHRRAPASLG